MVLFYKCNFAKGVMKMKKWMAIILAVSMLLCLNGCVESKKALDPNRTTEECTFFGTARVFGTAHQMNVQCFADGDGWYNVSFGHHHHK